MLTTVAVATGLGIQGIPRRTALFGTTGTLRINTHSCGRRCALPWHISNFPSTTAIPRCTRGSAPTPDMPLRQVNAFFAEDVNAELEDRLLEYAQDKLGCRSLSPLWMSYYVDGCHQGLHADNPHGEVFHGR